MATSVATQGGAPPTSAPGRRLRHPPGSEGLDALESLRVGLHGYSGKSASRQAMRQSAVIQRFRSETRSSGTHRQGSLGIRTLLHRLCGHVLLYGHVDGRRGTPLRGKGRSVAVTLRLCSCMRAGIRMNAPSSAIAHVNRDPQTTGRQSARFLGVGLPPHAIRAAAKQDTSRPQVRSQERFLGQRKRSSPVRPAPRPGRPRPSTRPSAMCRVPPAGRRRPPLWIRVCADVHLARQQRLRHASTEEHISSPKCATFSTSGGSASTCTCASCPCRPNQADRYRSRPHSASPSLTGCRIYTWTNSDTTPFTAARPRPGTVASPAVQSRAPPHSAHNETQDNALTMSTSIGL